MQIFQFFLGNFKWHNLKTLYNFVESILKNYINFGDKFRNEKLFPYLYFIMTFKKKFYFEKRSTTHIYEVFLYAYTRRTQTISVRRDKWDEIIFESVHFSRAINFLEFMLEIKWRYQIKWIHYFKFSFQNWLSFFLSS